MPASSNGWPRGNGKVGAQYRDALAPIDMTKDLSWPPLGLFSDDRAPSPELTAIGEPRGVRVRLQVGPPVGQPEVPQAEMLLPLDRVLSAGLIPEGVVGNRGWGYAELLSHKEDHRLWRVLVRSQPLARTRRRHS